MVRLFGSGASLIFFLAFEPCIFLLKDFASAIVLSDASVAASALIILVDNGFRFLKRSWRLFVAILNVSQHDSGLSASIEDQTGDVLKNFWLPS